MQVLQVWMVFTTQQAGDRFLAAGARNLGVWLDFCVTDTAEGKCLSHNEMILDPQDCCRSTQPRHYATLCIRTNGSPIFSFMLHAHFTVQRTTGRFCKTHHKLQELSFLFKLFNEKQGNTLHSFLLFKKPQTHKKKNSMYRKIGMHWSNLWICMPILHTLQDWWLADQHSSHN